MKIEQRLDIRPMSFGVEQRVQASTLATALGCGVVMELHSSHTEFYADSAVPVGKVAVYAPSGYKMQPEYVTTLNSPEQPWPVGEDTA